MPPIPWFASTTDSYPSNGMMATIREAGLMAVAKSKDVPLCIWVVDQNYGPLLPP